MPFRMPETAQLSQATLRVRDLEAHLAFWRDLLGLELTQVRGDRYTLAPSGGAFTLELVHAPQAPPRPHPSVGLYHLAVLLPGPEALGALLRRLLEARYPLEGVADHGVSEALYLRDPEGNGLELYRDRPKSAWPYRDGALAMFTRPLDVEGLLAQAPHARPLPPETRLGHVHLHVADLEAAEAFYTQALGLTVTQRTYPGARFLAAGDYHHHLGLNTWARGRRAPPEATGLVRYAWRVTPQALEELKHHLEARRVPYREDGAALELVDPAGVRVAVTGGTARSA
ncbi:VOC family protein [Marinithermus hydrothermalis]|uniref:Glyoxalase/bleomycin resistance protein/dioxygenase n=1 Tax=Marinithermus hydrothermalis (strain DSM 14884 / JCM 11576 / T1) TaxID=869210 RepID=F2NL59_MARHT|nr:VOC family protein [Marinithermus hydrothermalis]AEB11462.1 Glyoxalase/bleomycin resistance protein/dioxygenase [Marinithermus hydrothermalis DSM 14884]